MATIMPPFIPFLQEMLGKIHVITFLDLTATVLKQAEKNHPKILNTLIKGMKSKYHKGNSICDLLKRAKTNH